MAAQRVSQLTDHIAPSEQTLGKIGAKNSDDVVICAALRTPITRAKGGGLQGMQPEEILAPLLAAVADKAGCPKDKVEDIQVGNCRLPGAGTQQSRMAMLQAGFPYDTCLSAVNRFCSSGLQAVANVAAEIKSGVIKIGIGAGVEMMSYDSERALAPVPEWVDKKVNPTAKDVVIDCMLPMGITSENVAKQYKIDRKTQDAFALASYEKAMAAQKNGLFKEEIMPVVRKTADGKTVVVDRDDGVRPTNAEGLAKLRPAFTPDGFSTAGNSSQVSDGAGAVLLARRSEAEKLGLPILGKFVAFAVAGVPPRVMGIGPAYAIPKALSKAGINKDQVDIYEINEAFASQAIMSIDTVGLDYAKVNPKGGAIALGHPLGATGARQISTLFTELKRTGGKIGVTSMCIGSGMGAAGVFERE